MKLITIYGCSVLNRIYYFLWTSNPKVVSDAFVAGRRDINSAVSWIFEFAVPKKCEAIAEEKVLIPTVEDCVISSSR